MAVSRSTLLYIRYQTLDHAHWGSHQKGRILTGSIRQKGESPMERTVGLVVSPAWPAKNPLRFPPTKPQISLAGQPRPVAMANFWQSALYSPEIQKGGPGPC